MSEYEKKELRKLLAVIDAATQNEGYHDSVKITTTGHDPYMSCEIKGYVLRKFIAARFAAALAAEREECAKVAEEISPLTAGKVIAAAIRARGQK